MRWKGLLGLATGAILFAGCGGDEESDTSAQEREAQDAVTAAITAYEDQAFQTLCDVQDKRANDAVIKIAKTDTCPEAYEELFANQDKFAGVPGKPFDDFVAQLSEYEVGPATVPSEVGDFAAEVSLEGPIDGVRSFLSEEDGELKVSELFVTPDANATPESGVTP